MLEETIVVATIIDCLLPHSIGLRSTATATDRVVTAHASHGSRLDRQPKVGSCHDHNRGISVIVDIATTQVFAPRERRSAPVYSAALIVGTYAQCAAAR